jgi:hypothetical protein
MISKELPKPSSSNKQIKEYMTAVRKGMKSIFVVQKREGWNVHPAVEPGKSVQFASKEEALLYARAAAKTKQGEVFVFNLERSLIGQEKP